jgi:hypothetical protein
LCYKLQDTKAPVVNSTATATFLQLALIIFEKLGAIGNPMNEAISSTPAGKDAFALFQDFCIMTNGDAGVFLKIKDFTKAYGLELIESIVTQHHKLFKSYPELLTLLKERACPQLIKSFSDKLDYSLTVRLMRLSLAIIRHFHGLMVINYLKVYNSAFGI